MRTEKPKKQTRAEAEFDAQLRARLLAGEIVDYGFERETLRLGFDCRYTPDFDVTTSDGRLVFFEVKVMQKRKAGPTLGMEEDARVKLHAAASLFWSRVFVLAVRQLDGTWTETEIRP